MPYPLDSIQGTARFFLNKLEDAKGDLGLADCYYGDQERIPRVPTVCVEPGEKTRELQGAPRRTLTIVTTYVIVYHSLVAATEVTREADDLLAERIEALIHNDPYLNDADGNTQVMDSLVRSVESGYQQKKNSLFRASRLTVETRVMVQLPSAV